MSTRDDRVRDNIGSVEHNLWAPTTDTRNRVIAYLLSEILEAIKETNRLLAQRP